jgi:hypothetical protein
MIGTIVSLTSMLRAFVGHYGNGKKQWAMTTTTTKQQQQWEEDVEDESSHSEGGAMLTQARRHALTLSLAESVARTKN